MLRIQLGAAAGKGSALSDIDRCQSRAGVRGWVGLVQEAAAGGLGCAALPAVGGAGQAPGVLNALAILRLRESAAQGRCGLAAGAVAAG